MSKLDVGVGEEFPAEEANRGETVHHHHYHHRRHGHVLRVVLTVALIIVLVHWLGFAFGRPVWAPHAFWSAGFFPFGGVLLAVVCVALIFRLIHGRFHHRHRL